MVDIPMFPMLKEELLQAHKTAGKSKFCFPAAAEMYANNPDGITWRVKQILARALGPKTVDEGRLLPAVSPDEARSRGLAYIDSLGDTPKAARMRAGKRQAPSVGSRFPLVSRDLDYARPGRRRAVGIGSACHRPSHG